MIEEVLGWLCNLVSMLFQTCDCGKFHYLFSSLPSLPGQDRASSAVPFYGHSGLLGGRLGLQAAVGSV